MLGSVTRVNVCSRRRRARVLLPPRRVPGTCMSGMSSRATNEHSHEDGGQHDAGNGEDDLYVVAHRAMDQTSLARRIRARSDKARRWPAGERGRFDQRDQQLLAAEIVLGDRPCGGDAEQHVERDGDCRREQRQADGGERIRLRDRCDVGSPSLARSLTENTARRGSTRKVTKNMSDTAMMIHFYEGRLARGRALLKARVARAGGRKGWGGGGHQRALSLERALQACRPLMMSSRMNEMISMTAATAVAPA